MVAASNTIGNNDGAVTAVGSVGSIDMVGFVVPELFDLNLKV